MADTAARMFLCARCRVQVVLCSHCDRGNRYCGATCSHASRELGLREATRRYQRSPKGRIAHAARSRRWRAVRRVPEGGAAADPCVTHQGCPDPGGDAPLAPCEAEPSASPISPAAQQVPRHCRRCARVLPSWVRQGFLRRDRTALAHLAGWPPCPRGHSP